MSQETDPQNQAEAALRQELAAHNTEKQQKAKEAREQKDARASAKKAIREGRNQHRLLARNLFGGWLEGVSLLVFPGLLYLPLGGVGIALGIGLAFLYLVVICDNYGGLVARLQLAKERVWLSSLPFGVFGYLETLGRGHSREERRVSVEIVFAQNANPKEEIVRGMLQKLNDQQGYKEKASLALSKEGPSRMQSPTIETRFYGKQRPQSPPDRDNSSVHGWLRGLVREVLLPVHKAYPIEKISISG